MLPSTDLGPPQPEQFLTIDSRPEGERRVVLDVAGHVDAFTAPLLRACLRTQLSRADVHELVLDLEGVEFMGAAGVSVIVEASRRACERRLRFRLRACSGSVLRPLQLAGLLDGLEDGPDAVLPLAAAGALAHA